MKTDNYHLLNSYPEFVPRIGGFCEIVDLI
jgi:hypothetical protein